MTTFHCARFPNLYPSRHDVREGLEPAMRPLKALDATEETVYRAWARLLTEYGADDEDVTFHCNKGLAVVDLSKPNIEYIELDESRDASTHRNTGVFLGTVSSGSQNHVLSLIYSLGR